MILKFSSQDGVALLLELAYKVIEYGIRKKEHMLTNNKTSDQSNKALAMNKTSGQSSKVIVKASTKKLVSDNRASA